MEPKGMDKLQGASELLVMRGCSVALRAALEILAGSSTLNEASALLKGLLDKTRADLERRETEWEKP